MKSFSKLLYEIKENNLHFLFFKSGKTTLTNFLADAGDSLGTDYIPTIGCRYKLNIPILKYYFKTILNNVIHETE